MELKHLIFLGMTAVFIPTAVWFAINYEWAEKMLVAGTFFSTAYLIDVNFVSMEHYRGDTRGFEFGVTDWMVISLILVMNLSPRWKKKRLTLFPPNSVLMGLYFLVALISAFVAYVPLYAEFGLFKLIRAFAVYWVTYNYVRDEDDLRFFLMTLAAMVALEFVLVLKQRMSGIYRPPGSTPHSNTLAVYINMMNMIFFAYLLGDRGKRAKTLIYWACVGMASLVVLATFSRGALVSMILGFGLVTLLSFYDRIRPQKLRIIGFLFLAAVPVAIKVGPAVVDRFLHAPKASGESRVQANAAAIAMANNHPLGVGINNYSYVINNTSYSRFIPDPVDRGIVHNIYLLHACEMGWGGLVVFLLMIGNFFVIGIRTIIRRHDNVVSVMATGIVVAMFTLWFQSLLEWLFRQTYVTVEYFMFAGILAALPRVQKSIRKEKKLNRLLLLWRQLAYQRLLQPGR